MAIAVEQWQQVPENDFAQQTIDSSIERFMLQNQDERSFLPRSKSALRMVKELRQSVGPDIKLDIIEWYAQHERWFKTFAVMIGDRLNIPPELKHSRTQAYKKARQQMHQSIAQYQDIYGEEADAQLVNYFYQARMLIKNPENPLLHGTTIDEQLLALELEAMPNSLQSV